MIANIWVVFIFIQFFLKFVVSVKKMECGYKQCPQTKEGALNVHLIAHSHMDAGWVKTFDEYFYGTKTSISTANVQLIYHSVLTELLHDKRRKFTFSETAYFWHWWKEQRPPTRSTFRTLVQEGRVEFAGGGWTQNDEATADYLSIIDLYTWGLRKLNDTLGPCGKPKAAWQIDSYGHTREQISLLAQMGFDGVFIGRVDHREREAMIDEDRMEFMWRGSDSLGKMSDIMTHTLFNLYNPPDGFCFDFLCNDEPIMDDPESQAYNADKRVNDFISQIERQAKYYDHDNIMVMMGGDFTYQSAASWFMNMDKLINHVNTHPANMSDINIFYSTPSCYLKAIYLYGKRDKAVYTEKGDHVPYGSDTTTYWTGFYSSRPSFKYLARRAHEFLQVVKQLTVIARMGDSYELHLLRHAVSLVQHHDAITGTSQHHVIDDFIKKITEAMDACTKKISLLLGYLTPTWGGTRRSKNHQQFSACHELNISQCKVSETQESFLLLVYNPSSVKTYHYVRLPAVALNYAIKDSNDDEVEYQLLPLPSAMINLPGRKSTAIQELFFEAENIPPLGYSAFYISALHDVLKENEFARKRSLQLEENELLNSISNEYLKVTVDKATGLLDSVQHVDGVKIKLSQNFFYYSQLQSQIHSGAYSFRPAQSSPVPVADKVSFHSVTGSLVREIRQRFSDWITQIIRLYRGEEFLELEWIVGPVPIGSDLGKDVVTRFKTNITNNGQFFTDSNGRQMMKRSCWNESHSGHLEKKPIAACYYPVTSRICINSINNSVEICVLTDRAQGGTSYNEGEIELMVHRRLLTDDGFGLEEALNEEAYGVGLVVKGKHRIVFGNRQEMDGQTFSERASQAARRWKNEPWIFLTGAEKINRRKWNNIRNKRYSFLRVHALPRHVHVLTLEPWKAGSLLLRLENTLENSSKDEEDNSHVTVDLRKLFQQLVITNVRETTLAANQWLDEARQMDWSTRYVYSGGNDGILPEDIIDYGDDNKPVRRDNKELDSQIYSDEDQEFTKSRNNRNKSGKQKSSRVHKSRQMHGYARDKRSINITANDLENTINKTFDDVIKLENYFVDLSSTSSDVLTTNTMTVPSTVQPTIENKIGTLMNPNSNTTLEAFDKITTLSQKTENYGSTNNDKPMKSTALKIKTGEVPTFEEDFSNIIKKYSPRKSRKGRRGRNGRKTELFKEKSPLKEDDVTKSIYEMYYKAKPRTHRFRPMTRIDSEEYSEETTKSHKRIENKPRNKRLRIENDKQSDTQLPYEISKRQGMKYRKRRSKAEAGDIPFFLTDYSGLVETAEKVVHSNRYRKRMMKNNDKKRLQELKHRKMRKEQEEYLVEDPEVTEEIRKQYIEKAMKDFPMNEIDIPKLVENYLREHPEVALQYRKSYLANKGAYRKSSVSKDLRGITKNRNREQHESNEQYSEDHTEYVNGNTRKFPKIVEKYIKNHPELFPNYDRQPSENKHVIIPPHYLKQYLIDHPKLVKKYIKHYGLTDHHPKKVIEANENVRRDHPSFEGSLRKSPIREEQDYYRRGYSEIDRDFNSTLPELQDQYRIGSSEFEDNYRKQIPKNDERDHAAGKQHKYETEDADEEDTGSEDVSDEDAEKKSPNKRRKRADYEDEEDSVSEDDEESSILKRSKRSNTKLDSRYAEDIKIDSTSEPVEQADQTFLVTLRPTQIRTFVVWFEHPRTAMQL